MSSCFIKISSPLWKYTNNISELTLQAKTITDIFTQIFKDFPLLKDRIYDSEKQAIKKVLNVFLNDKDIRFINNFDTEINENDTIYIIPVVMGG